MERPQRLVFAALAGAVGLLILGWLIVAPTADPATTLAEETPPARAGATTAESEPQIADTPITPIAPTVERSTAAAPPPPTGPHVLTVTIVDPLDLLTTRHELCASGTGSLVCRQWRREGDRLYGVWPDEIVPPAVVEFFLEPLRPSRLIAASAPFEADPAGGWRATLDLTDAVAIVTLTAVGDSLLEMGCSWKASFRTGSTYGVLDLAEHTIEPMVLIAPVPCLIIAELTDRGGPSQYAQKTTFPILTGGRHAYDVVAGSGSVRMRVHEPPGPSNGPMFTYLYELVPELARGGWIGQRLLEGSGTAEDVFTLVAPGRYEVFCYEQQGSRRSLIGGRVIEVGAGETLVEFRSPEHARTLTVRHAAPAGTEFWLLRAGVAADAVRGAVAAPEEDTVRFEGLDAAEWVVWARNQDGVATAHADTRFLQDAEVELGSFMALSVVALQTPPAMRGNFQVRVTDATGRVNRPGFALQGRDVGSLFLQVMPGQLDVAMLHDSGLYAETTVFVPSGATMDAPFTVPLNFRQP